MLQEKIKFFPTIQILLVLNILVALNLKAYSQTKIGVIDFEKLHPKIEGSLFIDSLYHSLEDSLIQVGKTLIKELQNKFQKFQDNICHTTQSIKNAEKILKKDAETIKVFETYYTDTFPLLKDYLIKELEKSINIDLSEFANKKNYQIIFNSDKLKFYIHNIDMTEKFEKFLNTPVKRRRRKQRIKKVLLDIKEKINFNEYIKTKIST